MQAQFLTINSRRLFCVRAPVTVGVARYRILIAPPFAEELNKCRHLLALTMRSLAAIGCDVLLPDLYGTGDSEGDFADATWATWVADWHALVAWHANAVPEARPAILAARAGTLLTSAVLAEVSATPLVLWQPVLDGARYLQQFLRLRVMAERMAGGGETVAQIEQLLHDRGQVEIAGYSLNSALATGLAAARFAAEKIKAPTAIRILEFKLGAPTLTAPVVQLCTQLRDGGHAAVTDCISAEQFWATQEISAPQTVVDATVAIFSGTL